MEPNYRNGKIAGMMIAARVIQEWYESKKNYLQASDARELFAQECTKQGFDMFAYLRGDQKLLKEPT